MRGGGGRASRWGRWAAVGVLLGLASCVSTQRFPRPMGGPDDLPPGVGDLFPPGPEQALVIRHGDTIHVKRAGQDAIFRLRHFDKQVRIQAGAAVLSDASGRAEVVFPRGSRATLFGTNVAVLGSPSRGEPLLYLIDLAAVELFLGTGEYVVLPGGCQVAGPGGPLHISRGREGILVLRNRSPELATVRYRESTFELNPGEVVHLPELEVGTAPLALDPQNRPLPVGAAEATLWGDVETIDHDGSVLVAEAGVDPGVTPHEIRAFGLLVRLDANQRIALQGLAGQAIDPTGQGGTPATGPPLTPEELEALEALEGGSDGPGGGSGEGNDDTSKDGASTEGTDPADNTAPNGSEGGSRR